MSQCDGRAQLLGVDAVGGDGELAGVVEQVVQQDLRRAASAGTAATTRRPAALNMLPKLLDVPISTYLMVFAKIRRPSATPSARTPRLFSSRRTSAASLATSAAVSTEMPTSAACSASASLTPSPRKPPRRPCRRSSRTSARLLLGRDPGEDRGVGDRGGEGVVVEPSTSAPVSVPPTASPRSVQTFSGHRAGCRRWRP